MTASLTYFGDELRIDTALPVDAIDDFALLRKTRHWKRHLSESTRAKMSDVSYDLSDFLKVTRFHVVQKDDERKSSRFYLPRLDGKACASEDSSKAPRTARQLCGAILHPSRHADDLGEIHAD